MKIHPDGFTDIGIEFAGHGSNRVRPFSFRPAVGSAGCAKRPATCAICRRSATSIVTDRDIDPDTPRGLRKEEMRENDVLQKVYAGSG